MGDGERVRRSSMRPGSAVIHGVGRPLAPAVRAWAEPLFRYDFSRVSVYTDTRALAGLGAAACTVGESVVLPARRETTATSADRRLLAHELAHVVQQTQSPTGGVGGGSPAAEREAAAAAAIVARGGAAPALTSYAPAVACASEADVEAQPAAPAPTGHLDDDPVVPERATLSPAWGEGEFGGDAQVVAFVEALVAALRTRTLRGGLPDRSQHRSRRQALTREALAQEFETLIAYQRAHAASYGPTGLKHGWMRGLLSRLDFATRDQGPSVHRTDSGWDLDTAGRFAPMAERGDIPASVAAKEGEPREWFKVAPIMVSVLTELEALVRAETPPLRFRADNRRPESKKGPHWSGYAVDMYLEHEVTRTRGKRTTTRIEGLKPEDESYWDARTAIRFLLLVDRAAKAAHARWHVIYNDFRVADAVNRHLGHERVTYKGSFKLGKSSGKPDMEWHGPAPLVLHFHLDVVPDEQAGAR